MYLSDEQVDAFRQAFGALGGFFGLTEGLLVRAVASGAIDPADAESWRKANLQIKKQTAIVAAMLEKPGGGVH